MDFAVAEYERERQIIGRAFAPQIVELGEFASSRVVEPKAEGRASR